MDRNKHTRQLKTVWHRLLIILYVATAILSFNWFGDSMFYFDVAKDTWHLYRFFWCYSVALLAGAIGLWVRCDGYGTTILYVFFYPALLAAVAALVFVVAQASTTLNGYLFYYFTGGLCFILGITIEYLLNTVSDVFSALLKFSNKV